VREIDSTRLASLSVVPSGGGDNLVTSFNRGTFSYIILSGQGVKITDATPEDPTADVTITYGQGLAVDLNSTIVSVPNTIYITVSKGDKSSRYQVALLPAPNNLNDDKTLLWMDVFYEGEDEGQINFNSLLTSYSVNVPLEKAEGKILVDNVLLASSLSSVTIKYGATAALAQTVTEGQAVDVPTGLVSSSFYITVTAGNGNTQTYTVVVHPYIDPALVTTWSGTVTLSSLTGHTALAVVMRGADIYNSYSEATVYQSGTTWIWTINAPNTFTPDSFLVSIKSADSKAWLSKQYKPPLIPGAIIDLVVDGSVEIGKAVYSAMDLAGINAATNYSLADDIDLASQYPNGWTGPSGYAKKFYGNGYTINLTLSKGSGDIGLFNSLAGDAQIRDLVVDVSSPAAGISVNGATHFGGVVGLIQVNSTLPILLDNVKVKGELVYKDGTTGYLVVGGFIGEVYRNTTIHVTFQNCVSEINITENFTTLTSSPTISQLYTGGFIGRGESNIEFTNCYATGAISVTALNGTNTYVGGFIGYTYNGADPNVRIKNCYSTGTVSAALTAASPSALNIGGFSGGFLTTNASAYIQNCIAIGTGISATSNGTINIGRVVGIVSANKLTDNYALSSMSVTKNGTADTTVSSGTATDKNGEGKDDSTATGGLRNSATWTGVGFITDVWDFSGLATGWPVLK
jgi:hypothetical protein